MNDPSPDTKLSSLFERLILEHGSSVVQEKWNGFLKARIESLERENFALRAKVDAANARLQEKEKNTFGHLPVYLDTIDFDNFSRFGRKKGGLSVTEFAKEVGLRDADALAEIEEYLDWGAVDRDERNGTEIYRINAFGKAYLRHLDQLMYEG